ncbi:MAG TPA: hypothetical protein VGJ10_06070 [Paraburkholderia sp.]|jgi:hypothetical protein
MPSTTDFTGVYPKLRYQAVPVAPGESHIVNPGYKYVKVEDAAQENALGLEVWYDMPGDAVAAGPPVGPHAKTPPADPPLTKPPDPSDQPKPKK